MAEAEKRSAAEEKESYRLGYEQDKAAYENRLQELQEAGLDDSDGRVAAAKQGVKNAEKLLKHYSPSSKKGD